MVSWSKYVKYLLCGYRDIGNMDEQTDEQKDLRMAKRTETKFIYSWNTLYAICVIMTLSKEKYNHMIQTYTTTK